jgi:hypothetical protein
VINMKTARALGLSTLQKLAKALRVKVERLLE